MLLVLVGRDGKIGLRGVSLLIQLEGYTFNGEGIKQHPVQKECTYQQSIVQQDNQRSLTSIQIKMKSSQ
jgi:hypothetical protein